MELTAYEVALIAGGFGVGGTLLGALATYRLSIKLAERQYQHLREVSKLDAWHVSAREFITAFAGDIASLESGADVGDVGDFLRDAYEARHSRAVSVFERFVSERRRGDFKREWKCHCYGTDSEGKAMSPEDEELAMDHESLLFLHYSSEAHLSNPARPRKDAIQAMRKLLTYASSA